MDIFNLKPAVKTHVTGILERGVLFITHHPGFMSGFGEHLVPLSYIAPYNQPLAVFVELIEVIGNFLPSGLNCKIGLT